MKLKALVRILEPIVRRVLAAGITEELEDDIRRVAELHAKTAGRQAAMDVMAEMGMTRPVRRPDFPDHPGRVDRRPS